MLKLMQWIFSWCIECELSLLPTYTFFEKRLISRNQDDKSAIEKRLAAYTIDVMHSKDYDHVIINDKRNVEWWNRHRICQ